MTPANTSENRSCRGRGRLDHHVVDVLKARGHDAVPMARSVGVDVVTGDGLAWALGFGLWALRDRPIRLKPRNQPIDRRPL
jgi:hypothetical protein